MYEYYFENAGLKIALYADWEIIVSECMANFLCEKPLADVDCTIKLKLSDRLREKQNNGSWHGPEYYEYSNGKLLVFHSNSVGGEFFSVTEISEFGNVEIKVLEEYKNYFDGTFGVFNRIGIENILLVYKALMLHSSFIKYKEYGIVFAGPSGVGKSTQADLWQNVLSAEIINGDRAILRKNDNKWTVYSSLFSGTSGIALNESAPLKAIIILKQAKENKLRQIYGAEAVRSIYPEISVNRALEKTASQIAELCIQLITDIPVYVFECTPDKNAVMALKEGLSI